MSIDLRLLRYFVATVEAGSANRAATSLHLTQPTLSRQLRQLERDLDITLFDRRGRNLVTTRAGAALLPMARELLARADQFVRAAETLAQGRLERVRLAVSATTLTDVVAPFLAGLGATDPVLVVRELEPGGAESALAAGADLAIVGEHPGRGVESMLLGVLPVWAYVRPDDQWAARGAVPLTELVTRTLVVLGPSFRPRKVLDAALLTAGLGLGANVECDDAQIAQALAAAGRGVAVVSDDPHFDLVPLQIVTTSGVLRLRLYAAWQSDHHAAATLSSLAQRLAEFIDARYATDPNCRRLHSCAAVTNSDG